MRAISYIVIWLVIGALTVHSQGKRTNPKIDPNRPGVEILNAGIESESLRPANDPNRFHLLRLKNNMKWDLSVCAYDTSEARNGVVGIHYEVEPPPNRSIRSISSDESAPEIIKYPMGIPTLDSCDPFTLKSGRSVLFRVFRDHLVDKVTIRVDVYYEWEDIYEARTSREPSHSVRFFSGNATK
jgi:hypothetical protein